MSSIPYSLFHERGTWEDRNQRTEEPKFNFKELELLACARYVPHFIFTGEIKTARYYTISEEPKNQRI